MGSCTSASAAAAAHRTPFNGPNGPITAHGRGGHATPVSTDTHLTQSHQGIKVLAYHLIDTHHLVAIHYIFVIVIVITLSYQLLKLCHRLQCSSLPLFLRSTDQSMS
jgi:hypothetical protein